MKNIKIYLAITLLALIALSLSSCKKEFYTKANINPNAPANVPPSVLLTNVEVSFAYTQGGDLSRFASMFDQQVYGISRQSQAYYQYIFTGQDFDDTWANVYTSGLENNMNLMNKADAGGFNEYSGISRVMMAYMLQVTVDLWGSIPYSTALQGLKNTQPSYDPDVTLYGTITNLLNTGITYLQNPNPGAQTPSSDDLLYGGSAAQWIKFAYAIKARLYIHQAKHSSAAMCDSAIANAAKSFTTVSDLAQVRFGTAGNNNAPWFQFNNQRGDISFAYAKMDTMLNQLKDPRKPIYIDSLGEVNTGIGLATYYGGPTAPVEFITYEEMLFVQAEAYERNGNAALAQTMYDSAIVNNMTKLGVAPSAINTYMLANGVLSVTQATAISQIATQEWIALYLNPEAWATWRRCNSPTLAPVIGTMVPRRFLYPQTEYSLNTAHTPASTLYAPVLFWDN